MPKSVLSPKSNTTESTVGCINNKLTFSPEVAAYNAPNSKKAG